MTAARPSVVADRYRVAAGAEPHQGPIPAIDLRLDRKVLLLPRPSGSLESELLTRVVHPNVVRILDRIELDEGGSLHVLEFIPEPTLRTVLDRRRRLPASEVARLGGALASALEAIHRAGFAHGDLKPENIVMSASPKLIDFDCSSRLDGSSAPLGGTPDYAAPERLRGQASTIRSDVFSLGMVMFECLAGVRPELEGEIWRAPLLTTVTVVHRKLSALIDRALDPEPSRRFSSAAEIRSGLAELDPVELADSEVGTWERSGVQEELPTLDSLDAQTSPSRDETTVRPRLVPLRSGETPLLWVLLDDAVMRTPSMMEALTHLDTKFDLKLMDENDRFIARWEEQPRAPWVTLFGRTHVSHRDPLLEWLRDHADPALVMVDEPRDVEATELAIERFGLTGVMDPNEPTSDLLDALVDIIERRRSIFEYYDCLQLNLQDVRNDWFHLVGPQEKLSER